MLSCEVCLSLPSPHPLSRPADEQCLSQRDGNSSRSKRGAYSLTCKHALKRLAQQKTARPKPRAEPRTIPTTTNNKRTHEPYHPRHRPLPRLPARRCHRRCPRRTGRIHAPRRHPAPVWPGGHHHLCPRLRLPRRHYRRHTNDAVYRRRTAHRLARRRRHRRCHRAQLPGLAAHPTRMALRTAACRHRTGGLAVATAGTASPPRAGHDLPDRADGDA